MISLRTQQHNEQVITKNIFFNSINVTNIKIYVILKFGIIIVAKVDGENINMLILKCI